MPGRDFLDKTIDKRTVRNPEFPRLVDAARRRRELLRALTEQREEQKVCGVAGRYPPRP